MLSQLHTQGTLTALRGEQRTRQIRAEAESFKRVERARRRRRRA